MKYIFNRNEKDINNWARINQDLESTLEEIRNADYREDELKIYLLNAVRDATIREEQEMAFWEFDDPSSMPADARCDFVYRPTYLMTLIMVNIINLYPGMMEFSGVRETLRYALNACTGRGLCASGYDAYQGLCENVLLFIQNGILMFMKDWPLFSISFECVFRNALNRIEQDYHAGKYSDDAWGSDCKSVQERIIRVRYEGNARYAVTPAEAL